MQQPSGDWTYWEGDSETERYITPSILRSLVTLRSFGASIPDAVFDNGVSSLLRNLSVYHENEDILADAIWTLALLKHTPEALELWKSIDTRKLHRHGYLAYSYAGQILSVVPPEIG